MKKFICFLFSLFLLVNSAYADPCSEMYSKIPYALKLQITQLKWVDVNPTNDLVCKFIIRYYPCGIGIAMQMSRNLSRTIQSTSRQCRLVSMGTHKKIEGYCALEDVVTKC